MKRLESLKDSMLEALNEAFKDIFKSELDINSIKAQEFVNEANMHYDKAEYKEAKDLYEKAIKLGSDSGEIYARLGYIYQVVLSQDTGANINDCYKKAIAHYKKACAANVSWAYNNFANMYYNGNGVKQNYKKAKELYETGCDLSDSYAYDNLANMYKNGNGVKQNYKKAAELYEKACELGKADSCYTLAEMYHNGNGGSTRLCKSSKII